MSGPTDPPADLTRWICTFLRYRADHPATSHILDVIERLIDRPYRTHALIYGEPGTGKEGLARALHLAMNPGGEAPFVKIPSGGRDGASLSRHLFGSVARPGALDRAEGGTLFLDEVATMPREVQARLSPVLRGRFRRDDEEQPRECNVVVLGATDHDMAAAVREGRFRHDLYYRMSRIELTIAPLRARREDVLRAALWAGNRLLRQMNEGRPLALEGEHDEGDLVLDRDAARVLSEQRWEGNFRQLDRVMERALMLYREGDRVTVQAVRAACHGLSDAPPSHG